MKKGTAVSLVLGIALLAGLVADVTAAENSLSKAMMTPQSRHVSSSAHQFGHAAVISKRAAMMDGFAGGAAPPSASSSAARDHAAQPSSAGHKQVFIAALSLSVHDLGRLGSLAQSLAAEAGGYVEEEQRSERSYSGALRVDAAQLKSVVKRLEENDNVFRIEHVSLTSSDVTGQHADATAQVAVLQATRKQLMELMRKASTVQDTLLVQDRLTQINSQLDVLLGQLKRLDNDVALSVIRINASKHVTTNGRPDFSATEVVNRAVQALATLAKRLLSVCIYAVVFSPVVLVLVVAVSLTARALSHRLAIRNN